MSQGQSTQNTMNLPMRSLAAAVCVVVLGLAIFLLIRGIWIGLVGELIFAALMIFIKSRMTVGYHASAVDPLTEVRRSPLIDAPAEPVSVWQGVEVGTTSDGRRFVIQLQDMSTIIGGQTRSGKSVFLHALIAACAMDPNVRMAIFNGKKNLSFNQYKDIAKVDRSADVGKLATFLIELEREIERRYDILSKLGEEQLTEELYATGVLPLYVVFVDEVGRYTLTLPKSAGQRVVTLLTNVAATGAGAGVLLVATNQRTSVEFTPAMFRANLTQRIAFSVSDRVESDLILGPGSARRGRDASRIGRSPAQRGIAWADVAGCAPVRFRSDLIKYPDTLAIAEKAAVIRGVVDSSLNEPLPVDGTSIDGVNDDEDYNEDYEDDILEEDVLGPVRDLLADIKSVWGRDEERLHNSVILSRLKDRYAEEYSAFTPQLFGRRMTEIGLAQYQKQWEEDGRVNHRGIYASALYAGPDGKSSKMERLEREAAALDALSDVERSLYEAKIAELLHADACSYCFTFFGPDNTVTIDHIVPLVAGGSAHPVNLAACCKSCNSSKGSKPLSEWLAARR